MPQRSILCGNTRYNSRFSALNGQKIRDFLLISCIAAFTHARKSAQDR